MVLKNPTILLVSIRWSDSLIKLAEKCNYSLIKLAKLFELLIFFLTFAHRNKKKAKTDNAMWREKVIEMTCKDYQMDAFNKCTYHYCESSVAFEDEEEKGLFIQRAVNRLDKRINLYHYGVVIMPELPNKSDLYLTRYIYRFNQPRLYMVSEIIKASEDKELCSNIRQQNVLVIDDVTTNLSTLNEVLRILRILNKDNDIRIFSLKGRKNLIDN